MLKSHGHIYAYKGNPVEVDVAQWCMCVYVYIAMNYVCFQASAMLMTLFRAVVHLLWAALLSATSRLTPSAMLSRMAFFLTHTSFEAG